MPAPWFAQVFMSRLLIACLAAVLGPFSLSITAAHAGIKQPSLHHTAAKRPGCAHKYDIGDDSMSNGHWFQGEIVGRYKFLLICRPHNLAYIVVYRRQHVLYRIPDERIDSPAGTFEPGETEKGYDFYLSPDRRYLFVDRGICNDNGECYLYRRVGRTKWQAVHHAGMEIGDAGLYCYGNRYHVDANRLGSVTFVTHFHKWIWTKRTHAIVMEAGAASFVELAEPHKGDLVAAYQITYNLRTGRFSHIVPEQM